MLKKLILATAGITLSGAAFAQPPHWAPAHGYRAQQPPVRYVVQRPVFVQHYYRPAPRPVYIVHRAPPPPPVYVEHHAHLDAAPLIFGAIVGAAVMHGVMTGH